MVRVLWRAALFGLSATYLSIAYCGNQVANQQRGKFTKLKRNSDDLLGAESEVWARSKPSDGIYNVTWDNRETIKIAFRRYFTTSIVFPRWEVITEVNLGSPEAYKISNPQNHVVQVVPLKSAGADSSITMHSKSGNVYTFYVKTESFNTSNVTDLKVNVRVPLDPNEPKDTVKENDYLADVLFNPDALQFNFNMYGDSSLAPERVYTDGVRTWLDFGNRVNKQDGVVVFKVSNGVDILVNYNWVGNKIIIQDSGDFALKHDGRFVCITKES